MKILGIDMGERRIGLALSDPLGYTAQGLNTVQIKNPEDVCDKLMDVIKEKKVELLVFGLPKNMNGTLGPQAKKVQEYADKLKQLSGLPVDFEDERLSTVSAEQVLLMADQSRAKRKKAIDRMAAVIILQSYLDRNRNQLKGLL
ncbi:MAG: Holliday junction resolvase RuvX [Candidatus Caldatribacteriota bacterium]|nr:Holliday junction resolvase RuvX [Atribacterota bacterium]MDD3641098.1 Holliday junction resolvase RuvX [Atribacterota bacterium]MDD4289238.1 Holliday junction resolvase RuvX [Atribacterota bacterium]MDD4765602.1 Holliday junction resolvase RuvX [Atribacterota bacterium]MDD5635976.1 Holliday junction resolvase RuvX [Atribacterota bacterium]